MLLLRLQGIATMHEYVLVGLDLHYNGVVTSVAYAMPWQFWSLYFILVRLRIRRVLFCVGE